MIIGGGITFDSAMKASKILATEGIHARVLDIFSIKPIDRDGIIANAKECNDTVLTVEDHYIEGGIHGKLIKLFILIQFLLLNNW